ncbi:unnamed protein product [Ilex paraguariensis]|uniref:DUF674 domain-containing protein n=1 Tax=Ilex paraguariensis TaxID=185542 RepID=A0ABC8V297_9AQUA
MADSKVSLKLLIDTKTNKVLFAEAGKDFVDFLFNLLSLPVGAVVRLLTKQSMVGSLGNLYESFENLSETYFQPDQNKDSLLKPKICASQVPLLLPDVSFVTNKKFYTCSNYQPGQEHSRSYGDFWLRLLYESDDSSRPCSYLSVADDPSAVCPKCNAYMTKEVSYVARAEAEEVSAGEAAGGYVRGVVTYMVMDDLAVKPMSTISSITMLNKFNVKDVGALEERVVDFGMNEGVQLLKTSLQSETVLTTIFLGNMVELSIQ